MSENINKKRSLRCERRERSDINDKKKVSQLIEYAVSTSFILMTKEKKTQLNIRIPPE